jgi:2'-5' RNA ligase
MVAILIPEPTRSRLMDIQNQLKPEAWRITMDPHITLLAPDRPKLPTEEVARSFSNLSLPHRFSISTSGLLHVTRHQRHTLVLSVAPLDRLHELYGMVVSSCDWQDVAASNRRSYQPHITLFNQLNSEQLRQANARLGTQDLVFEFSCQTITLFAKQTSWPTWRPLATVNLK